MTGGINFADLKLVLKPADEAAKVAEVAIQYGAFINTLIQFLIVAAVIFLLVKGVNSLRRQQAAAPEAPAGPTADQVLLTEIRDLLKK